MPFATKWSVGSDDSTIDVQVIVLSEEALKRHSANAILSPIVDLINLAACGGLSGSHKDPQYSRAQIITTEIAARHVRWILNFEGVDSTVLRNVEGSLLYFDSAIAPIQSASVRAPSAYISAKEHTPPRFLAPPPFQFVDERQEFRSLVLEIGFAQPTPELMERIETEAFGMWVCAASAGCFCSEKFPPELSKVYLGDSRHSSDSLILGLDELSLPEPFAIDSLINTLTWSHYRIARISSVELYD